MGTKLFASFITLALGCAVAAGQTTEWVRYAPQGQGFSILLPQNPTVEEDSGMPDRVIHRAMSDDSVQGAVFLASYWDFPSNIVYSLDKIRNSVVPEDRSKIISESNISIGGYAGGELQFWVTSQGIDFKDQVRFYIIGQRVYMLQYISPKQADASLAARNAAKFFDSFEISSGH